MIKCNLMEVKKILIVDKLNSRKLIIKELSRLGYIGIDLFEQEYIPNKHSVFNKVCNLINRIILRNNKYYEQLNKRRFDKFSLKALLKVKQSHPKISYALFFSPEWLSEEVISTSRGICEKMISYHYDGIFSRNEKMRIYSSYFDLMYSFDIRDIKNFPEFNLKPATNFWIKDDFISQDSEFDLFYLGVGTKERIDILNKLYKYCDRNQLTFKSFATVNKSSIDTNSKIGFLDQPMSYENNLDYIKKTSAIIDIKLSYHNGLSFRFYEAMNYNKKIITNNSEVTKYEFFDPNNILVTDFYNIEKLVDFLKLPYKEINKEIKGKYSFENWIKYILDTGDFLKVELPT